MASITTTALFLSSTTLTNKSLVTGHRTLVVANAASGNEVKKIKFDCETRNERNNGRRDLMFAAAAAACSVARIALVAEPKPGTLEAKQFYAPACVSNPTVKIYRK